MAAALPRGTRIGRPVSDGSLVLGTVVGPAFGEGFYCARMSDSDGARDVCVHVCEVIVEPSFASLAEAAEAMRALDRREVADRRLRVAGGAS